MKKELQKVADLWAEQIQSGEWDNGHGLQSAMGMALRRHAQKPTEEQIEKFKTVLIEECEKSFISQGLVVNLGVDYQGDSELVTACEQSGINTDLLPVKSDVFASPGKVSYKFGYASPMTHIKIQ